MTVKDNTYKGILKNMSVFGGVQFMQIVAGLLRGKIAAIFLGPSGMGISALFTTSSTTLQQLSSLGLGQSIVRETAAAEDDHDVERVVRATRFMLIVTALIGAAICFFLATPLSEWSFGNRDFVKGFMLLSVMVFFTTLANGEIAVLQGLHRVKRLAQATTGALVIGLVAIIPFYVLMGSAGIVPAMVVNALGTYAYYRYCTARETRLRPSRPIWRVLSDYRMIIWRMVSMGVVLMAAQLLGSLSTYLINAYVRYAGSTADVGLYQSANSLTTQCVSLVFAAMAMEFFPRLTTVVEDRSKISLLVNRQIEVVSLVAAPIAAVLMLTAPLVVRIVLSQQFLSAVPLIRWMCLGILFKAISYPPGYISFAKGDRTTFFLLEGIAGNVVMLGLSVILYKFFGIIGLGIASSATFFIFIGVYIILTRRLYGYAPSKSVVIKSLVLTSLLSLCLAFSMMADEYIAMTAMAIGAVAISTYSLMQLRRLMKSPSDVDSDADSESDRSDNK